MTEAEVLEDDIIETSLPEYEIHECINADCIHSMQEAEVNTLNDKLGWHEKVMQIPVLWKQSKGAGIRVAVLDTGIDLDHPDLYGQVIQSKSFVGEPVEDGNSHGTLCSSIIAAKEDGKGVIGIAPQAKLIIGKVLRNTGGGSLRSIANGIRWAVDQRADIISMSLGAPKSTPELNRVIHEAIAKGVIVLAAAGNSGRLNVDNSIGYPARLGSVIAVGSHDKQGRVSGFSSYGGEIDFTCPGENIYGAGKKGTYVSMSGTSFATPIAAGIAALILSKHRKRGGNTPIRCQEDMYNHLVRICSHPGAFDPRTGYGPLRPFQYRDRVR